MLRRSGAEALRPLFLLLLWTHLLLFAESRANSVYSSSDSSSSSSSSSSFSSSTYLPHPYDELASRRLDDGVLDDPHTIGRRAINSSLNGYCLRDNLARVVTLTPGSASTARTLTAYDCLVYYMPVGSSELSTSDITFTITSTTVPAPTDILTTWKLYRYDIVGTLDDTSYDFTSQGLTFVLPNCMAKLSQLWVVTVTSSETYSVRITPTFTGPVAPVDVVEGVDYSGTWTSTNSWRVLQATISDTSGSRVTLSFSSTTTTSMVAYVRVGACPTMHDTYYYSALTSDSTVEAQTLAVGNGSVTVYIALAPLSPGFAGTGDVTIGFTRSAASCSPTARSLSFCGSPSWPSLSNISLALRDQQAQAFYNRATQYAPVTQACLDQLKNFLCLALVAPPCRQDTSESIPPCVNWCDQVFAYCPARLTAFLRAELRELCLPYGQEVRDPKQRFNPPLNCYPTPVSDPIDIWDFTDRPFRNPLLWTLIGFGGYMSVALVLAMFAVCLHIHLERRRKMRIKRSTALQELGLAL